MHIIDDGDSIRYHLVIPSAPPTINHIWGRRGSATYLTKAAKVFHTIVKGSVGAWKLPEAWKYYSLNIIIRPPRRRCDVDNRIKALLDSFTRAGLWEDDERVSGFCVRFLKPSKECPAGETIVTISESKEKYWEELQCSMMADGSSTQPTTACPPRGGDSTTSTFSTGKRKKKSS